MDDYIVRKKVREALEETAQDAREKLKLAERLFEAKKRRWEAPKNHRGERKLQKSFRVHVACRIYEAVIELNQAELWCAWSETAATKASHALECCLVRMKRLECERLQRHMADAWADGGVRFWTVVTAAWLRSTFDSGNDLGLF